MRWYIQSCGKGYEQGFHWVQVFEDKDNQPKESSAIIPIIPSMYNIGSLINNEGFSLLLASDGKEIALQVRGLRTERSGGYGEVVNMLACVGNFANVEEESIIRGIVVQSLLKEGLDDIVDEQVVFNSSKIGFEVKNELIKRLQLLERPTSNEKNEFIGTVNEDTPDNRRALAEDIKKYALVQRQGIFVVVTTKAKVDVLEKAYVWRGLSSRVNAKDEYSIPRSRTKRKNKGFVPYNNARETAYEDKSIKEEGLQEGNIAGNQISGNNSLSEQLYKKQEETNILPQPVPVVVDNEKQGEMNILPQSPPEMVDSANMNPSIPHYPPDEGNNQEMQPASSHSEVQPHSSNSFTSQSLILAAISLGVLVFMFIVTVIVLATTHANITGLFGIVIALCVTIFAINIYFSYSRKKNNDES